MKIIKQNDSAVGLIFKQNTGGKAMKQNYNFGKCYIPGVNGSFYRINKLTGETHPILTIISVTKRDGTGGSAVASMTPYLCASASFSNYYSSRIETQFRVFDQTSQVGGSAVNTPLPLKMIMCQRIGTNEKFRFGANYGTVTEVKNSISSIVSTQKTLQITSFTGLYNPGGALTAINRLVAFTRSLSDVEIDYFINNMLGNELLNESNLLFDIKWGQAKVISDLPSFEDLTGNGYDAELLGLPAGSPQDKVDYVNSNRLILW